MKIKDLTQNEREEFKELQRRFKGVEKLFIIYKIAIYPLYRKKGDVVYRVETTILTDAEYRKINYKGYSESHNGTYKEIVSKLDSLVNMIREAWKQKGVIV